MPAEMGMLQTLFGLLLSAGVVYAPRRGTAIALPGQVVLLWHPKALGAAS